MLVALFDSPHLPATLVNVQPQLSSGDDLYITVKDRSTADRIRPYATTRSIVYIEVTNNEFDLPSIRVLMDERHQKSLLVVKDVLVSQTLVSNMNRAGKTPFHTLTPRFSDFPMDPNFNWFNSATLKVVETDKFDTRCFYTSFTGSGIGLVENELVTPLC